MRWRRCGKMWQFYCLFPLNVVLLCRIRCFSALCHFYFHVRKRVISSGFWIWDWVTSLLVCLQMTSDDIRCFHDVKNSEFMMKNIFFFLSLLHVCQISASSEQTPEPDALLPDCAESLIMLKSEAPSVPSLPPDRHQQTTAPHKATA